MSPASGREMTAAPSHVSHDSNVGTMPTIYSSTSGTPTPGHLPHQLTGTSQMTSHVTGIGPGASPYGGAATPHSMGPYGGAVTPHSQQFSGSATPYSGVATPHSHPGIPYGTTATTATTVTMASSAYGGGGVTPTSPSQQQYPDHWGAPNSFR